MIQEQLAHLPEFLSDYRPFPPAKNVLHGRAALRAKQRFLQAGEAALQRPLRPCRSRSGWISPTPGGAPHGRRLTSPAGRGCAHWYAPSA